MISQLCEFVIRYFVQFFTVVHICVLSHLTLNTQSDILALIRHSKNKFEGFPFKRMIPCTYSYEISVMTLTYTILFFLKMFFLGVLELTHVVLMSFKVTVNPQSPNLHKKLNTKDFTVFEI